MKDFKFDMSPEAKGRYYRMALKWLETECAALPEPDVIMREFWAMMQSAEARTTFMRNLTGLGMIFQTAERKDLVEQLDMVVKGLGLLIAATDYGKIGPYDDNQP